MGSIATDFLIKQLLILSWNASVQRANVYKANTSDNDKKTIRIGTLKILTEDIIPEYANKTDDEQHCIRIEELISKTSNEYSNLLSNNRYGFGPAQKLLNLTLKYYWCLNLIPEPPHCPVDRIIIESTRLRNKGYAWTKLKNRDEYLDIIEVIREKANVANLSIAKWELDNYNTASMKNINPKI